MFDETSAISTKLRVLLHLRAEAAPAPEVTSLPLPGDLHPLPLLVMYVADYCSSDIFLTPPCIPAFAQDCSPASRTFAERRGRI